VSTDPAADAQPTVPVVLWRPGCGFCRLLFSNLDRHEVAYEVRNIWDDDEARALLNERIGCETVPSVLIDDELLVNPSITAVLERIEA
jgi:glutaredoxin-related protein